MLVRLHLEKEPEHAAIKLDNENHFNDSMRHAALQFCASRPKLAPIMPALHATHEYGSPLHYHDGTRADDAVVVIRFIKFNLTSRAYQTKSSPLEGLARPRALPRPPPYGHQHPEVLM